MNKVIIVGRLTKDPEIKLTSNQTQFCSFTVAVDRRFKDANGQRQADFISCLAWKQNAVFIQKYFKKGSRIGLVGSIQTRSYDDQNGQKRYITEVVVDEVEFVESNNRAEEQPQTPPQPQPQEAQPVQNVPTVPAQTVPVQLQEESGELPFEI